MGVYLEDHPPARTQFRRQRRAQVTGAVVLHTAENVADTVDLDDGAEGVASFIARRTDAAGSYHTVVDSNSVVRVGRYEWEMFGEGTGGNRWALHLSFACRADHWQDLPLAWVEAIVESGAVAAADMAVWVWQTHGVSVPARRITPTEYRAGKPGFIGHGELDPGRRHDPGANFPWDAFLAGFAAETGATMPNINPTIAEVTAVQNAVNAAGYSPALKVDGDLGPLTWAGIVWFAAHGSGRPDPDAELGVALRDLIARATS